MTLCVTAVLWCQVDVGSTQVTFSPSASYFDEAKVTKAFRPVSGPTSSGSFALTLIQAPQRAIHGPVR
ncbi:hypothetical protein [Pseudomonas amygdali]|uniref:hypothetical protein n=1 Tax=Pseudomonas amygdali TaxID=47877 RepID=UPI0012B8B5C4|nr:hypothetical protein [Pseudomonas amygdali]